MTRRRCMHAIDDQTIVAGVDMFDSTFRPCYLRTAAAVNHATDGAASKSNNILVVTKISQFVTLLSVFFQMETKCSVRLKTGPNQLRPQLGAVLILSISRVGCAKERSQSSIPAALDRNRP